MNFVNWFEIPVADMARAISFYEKLLSTTIELHDLGELQMGWFPMKREAMGATGALVKHGSYVPSHSGTLVYFTVPDVDIALEKVKELGGKVLAAKRSIGEFGHTAMFEDTEGNRVALHMSK